MNERAQETKAVKKALATVGIKARVDHGKGTAWGWLHIYVGSNPYEHLCHQHIAHHCFGMDAGCSTESCLACQWYQVVPKQALRTTLEVTGRKGEYDGRVNILTQ